MPPHFRRQFREYGSGGSRDDLIGAGNLRNQPVCAVDAAPRMRTAERNSSNLQNLHDGLASGSIKAGVDYICITVNSPFNRSIIRL